MSLGSHSIVHWAARAYLPGASVWRSRDFFEDDVLQRGDQLVVLHLGASEPIIFLTARSLLVYDLAERSLVRVGPR